MESFGSSNFFRALPREVFQSNIVERLDLKTLATFRCTNKDFSQDPELEVVLKKNIKFSKRYF